jgi:cytochrome c-type biogenesis protein CcmH/NrfG
MSEKVTRPILQRFLVIVFSVIFLGSTGVFLLEMFKGDSSARQNTNQPTSSTSPIEQLQAKAKGYETVLAREPNNPIALQGLAEARLAAQDFKGAIVPLEKLVQLNPQQEQLKAILAAVKQQASIQNQEAKPSQK